MSLSQVLAPQLQQSLALLQAPTLELKALVEQEVQLNPCLEEVPAAEMEQLDRNRDEGTPAHDPADLAEPPPDVMFDPATEKPSSAPVDDFQAEFERAVQQDQEWRDHFSQTNLPMRSGPEAEERRQFMFDSLVASTSLQETLLEQMRFSEMTDEERRLGEMIIGNIDERGRLMESVESLSFSSGEPLDKIAAALKVIQTFDPPGVAARDLRECLLLQMERAGSEKTVEYSMVRDFMDALYKRKFPEIARGLGLTVEEVQEAHQRITCLEAHPGRAYLPDDERYVLPEVFVTKVGNEYVVTTNNEQIPHLRISNHYKDLMSQANAPTEAREWVRERIRAGKFLIKSLQQRQQTILNIGREIVQRQREFMDKGRAYLKPMTMVQVAEVVKVHETTVSRAVSNKYMETPQGIYEMKFFFTSGIQTDSGNGMSNTSVKDMVAAMFAGENAGKPLSDAEIVKMLKEKGIVIARRTVAKYRAELNILPSNLRKVY
jgi:RNA polymerase sigma-54 factor